VLVLALAACADSAGPDPADRTPVADRVGAAAPVSSTTLADWPAYHHDARRSGHVSVGPSGALVPGWSRRLVGATYGEPLVVGSTLVVATEHNDVYGLDARTGRTRWHVALGTPQPQSGLPCGDIDPLGITGTPAYDRATGSVFVAAETAGAHHTLWALDARTGARRWHRSLDVLAGRDRHAEQQRAALLVAGGRVLTAFGGLAGDCGNYVGYLTSVPVDGRGPTYHYAVPTAREAGIWAPPGPVRYPGGDVYVASGNGAERGGRWDKSDSVTALTAGLVRHGVFAPATWADDNRRDLDLGSSSPVPVPAVKRLVIAGKRGVVYLLRPRLRGVGSAAASLPGCAAFGGAAVTGTTVLLPCRKENAIRALRVGASGLHWGWTAEGVYGAPVVAGNRVYVADMQTDNLVVLRLADGGVLQRLPVGDLPHFPSEVVSGDWVYVPALDGLTAFHGG
jgi:outer membrane protein assembly factor BamB